VGVIRLLGALGREDHMVERRRSVRQNCRLCGRVHFNDGRKSKSVPCTVSDISYAGARIELSDPTEIPDAIHLYIPRQHRTLHASVRWRRGNRVGIAFSSVPLNIAAPPTRYAVLGGSISIVP
jgi:hypothetical protein